MEEVALQLWWADYTRKIYPVKIKLGTPTRGVLGKTPIYSSGAEKRPPLGGSKEGD